MKVLVLGSGGREHALALSIANSPLCEKVYIAPGNGGTAKIGENVALDIMDFAQVANFCLNNQCELLVVGPEAPLVAGIADYFTQNEKLQHIAVLGPNKEAAQLEGSKAYAKAFMQENHIPTAQYASFSSKQITEAKDYVRQQGAPIVLKADGLAAGKGVLICKTVDEAIEGLDAMLHDKQFGDAGSEVVIEQFLEGTELSVFALTDGNNHLLLPTAKDYKRIGEGDTGLNTGGMGALSPSPIADDDFLKTVEKTVVEATIKGLQKRGISYRGFLYFGLMRIGQEAFVIEYNARMGDPETQAVLPRVEDDLLPLLKAAATGQLSQKTLNISPQKAATVVLVSKGYPGKYAKGQEIHFGETSGCQVFHAGTKQDQNRTLTNGGRVLAITALGADFSSALEACYANAAKVCWSDVHFRKDIGYEVAQKG